MKKSLLYKTFLLLFLCFVGVAEVKGEVTDYLERNVNDGKAILLCEYTSDGSTPEARIYYLLDDLGTHKFYNAGDWSVVRRKNNEMSSAISELPSGIFTSVFINNSDIHYQKKGGRMTEDMEENFTCPNNYFFHNGWIFKESCFGLDSTCGSHFEKGPYNLNRENTTSVYYIIDEYVKEEWNNIFTAKDDAINAILKGTNLVDQMEEQTRKFIGEKYKLKYQPNSIYFREFPIFINNYINKSILKDEYSKQYDELYKEAQQKNEKDHSEGNLSDEEYEQNQDNMEKTSKNEIFFDDVDVNIDINPDRDDKCNGVLGPRMTEIVQNIFDFVKYLGPILIAVLSGFDFVKAAISGDDGDIKKASQRLGKRIIFGILLFFVPVLCQLVFDLAGITVPEYCIEQYKTTK